MRLNLYLIVAVIVSFPSFSQVAIGTGTPAPTPNPKAVLYLSGTNQGLILPIVSNLTAVGAGTTEKGMLAFNSADNKVYYFDGSTWVAVGGSGSTGTTGLKLQGNVLSLDPTGTSSIGIANPAPTNADQGRLLLWDGTQWTTTPKPTGVGQVLQWNGTAWVLSTISGGTGTVTNVSGTSPITVTNGSTTPTISLANTTVTAGTYGNASNVGQFTVDAQGRITNATNVPLASVIPTLGGDLSGVLATATVTGIQGKQISSTAPSNGQILQFSSGQWLPATLTAGSGVNITNSAGNITFASTGLSNPMTTAGDIIYGGVGGTPTRLATGTGFLRGGATPSYSLVNLASDISGTLPITSGGTGATTATGALNNLGALGTTLTNGNIFVGNASNVATGVAMSGDVTISNAGVTAIGAGVILNADISGTAAIAGTKITPAFGTQNISTTGTLSAGATTVTGLTIGTSVWPSNAAGVLTNNGTGTLSWTPTVSPANTVIRGNATGTAQVASSITDDGTRVAINGVTNAAYKFLAYGVNESLAIDNTGNIIIGDVGGNSLGNYFLTDFESTPRFSFMGASVGIDNTAPAYPLDVKKNLSGGGDAQIRVLNTNAISSAKAGVRMEVTSAPGTPAAPAAWAVQLQTSYGANWLELTDYAGNIVHAWQYNSYYPGNGTGYLQGTGTGLALMGGNVGIGMANPLQALDVSGNINTSGFLYFDYPTSTSNYIFGLSSYCGVNNHWIPNNNNTYDLGTTGFRWRTVYTNNTVNVSDIRLKKNIAPLTYGLSTILALKPVSYVLKDDQHERMNLGLIAQEAQKVIPEIVFESQDTEKTLGLDYVKLVPVLIKAIQEQQQRITELSEEVAGLKNAANKANQMSAKKEAVVKQNNVPVKQASQEDK